MKRSEHEEPILFQFDKYGIAPGSNLAADSQPLLTTRELIAIATSQEAVEKRALALWYALGTDRRPTGLVSRPSLSSASAKKAALAAPFERLSNRFRASANERTTTSLNYGMDTLKLWDGHREIMGWTP